MRYDLGVPARRVAIAVWGSMVLVPLLFLGVVRALPRPARVGQAGAGLLLAVAVAASAAGIVLSRVVPPRIPLAAVGGPHVGTLARFVVAWALCEVVAIFPLVVHELTRDDLFLAPFAVDWLAIAAAYPTRARWRAALPDERPQDEVH